MVVFCLLCLVFSFTSFWVIMLSYPHLCSHVLPLPHYFVSICCLCLSLSFVILSLTAVCSLAPSFLVFGIPGSLLRTFLAFVYSLPDSIKAVFWSYSHFPWVLHKVPPLLPHSQSMTPWEGLCQVTREESSSVSRTLDPGRTMHSSLLNESTYILGIWRKHSTAFLKV